MSLLSDSQCRKIVYKMLAGEISSEELKIDKNESSVNRITFPFGSAIIKLWNKPGWKGLLRTITHTSPMFRESQALQVLRNSRVTVPLVLGTCQLSGKWTEALLLEDLGDCKGAFNHVKSLAHAGREYELIDFVDGVLQLTSGLWMNGILDADHSLYNIVITPDKRIARLDFEIARRSLFMNLHPYKQGVILGRLITSYTYAVQPHIMYVEQFARRLHNALKPSGMALQVASLEVKRLLYRQKKLRGIDTKVKLPW